MQGVSWIPDSRGMLGSFYSVDNMLCLTSCERASESKICCPLHA